MRPSDAELRAFIRAAVRKRPGSQWLGLRVGDAGEPSRELAVDDAIWTVCPVRSSLEARRALVRAKADQRTLLLCTTSERDLGKDVMVRLDYRGLETLTPWDAVREAFAATELDPRLVGSKWMATALIDAAMAGHASPAPNGFLDLDTAWGAILPHLGIGTARPGLHDVLDAAMAHNLGQRLNGVDATLLHAAIDRVRATAGTTGEAVMRAAMLGPGTDVEAIGVVLDVLHAEGDDAPPEALAAGVRLERFGARSKDPTALRAWATAALDRLRARAERGSRQSIERVLRNAEDLVHQVEAEGLVERSDVLPAGLEARVQRLAAALSDVAEDPTDPARQEAMEQAWQRVARHLGSNADDACRSVRERRHLAVRLGRWLGCWSERSARLPGSLAELAQIYVDEAAWVDRARDQMLAGEGHARLIAAMEGLLHAATVHRERINRAFGSALAQACRDECGTGRVLLLEDVLARVVQPLVSDRARLAVLLVVMDGMSHAKFTEVAETVERRGTFRRCVTKSEVRWPPVITPLPSITEACRPSLLCGALTTGGQQVEAAGFAAMVKANRWGAPGASATAGTREHLFHKGDLIGAGGSISPTVAKAIESEAKVVAVVVNAIDDQLSRGEQTRGDHRAGAIPVLEGLLDLAEGVRRCVVLVADHGHIVERGDTHLVPCEQAAARWRSGDQVREEGEERYSGRRVLKPEPGGSIVAPWSERLRYGQQQAGYHGGASPQEVVAPLGVWIPHNAFAAPGLEDRWQREAVPRPIWWERSLAEFHDGAIQDMPGLPALVPPGRPETLATPLLFESGPPPDGEPAVMQASWVRSLMESEGFRLKGRSGRRSVPPTFIERLLTILDAANGTRTIDELCVLLNEPEHRLRGMLTAVQTLVNIDDVVVLLVSAADRTVRLDVAMLRRQFGLGGDP